MNISHTCCVSLVGFDWGPNPSLGCMNVGLNIHQMLSQKLYPLLSTTQKGRNRPPRRPKEPSHELNLSLWFTYCVVVELFRLHCSHVWGFWYVVWVYGYGWGHLRSIPYISNIHLLYCYCLQVPPQPFNPQWTTSSAVCSLRVSLELLTCILQGSPQGRFDAWFIIHVLIIQSLRHLPGGGCCSTLPSTHN